MRKILSALIAVIVLSVTFSCTSGKDHTRSHTATELYAGSIRLIKLYTDSMLLARDSMRVNSLAENLNNALTELNFKYAPDSDILLSEGENDTLALMVDKFVKLKNEQLYGFAHPIVRGDSVPTDSITGTHTKTASPEGI